MSAGILLSDPKYPHNVGAVIRAASCYGATSVRWTGSRVTLEGGKGERRLPREERMKAYQDVDYGMVAGRVAFDSIPDGVVPVAVELRPSAEQLPDFVHPENAVYVFGPEDGGLRHAELRHCHRVVLIPTHHCLNLSAAVYTVLYDRMTKRRALKLDPIRPSYGVLDEDRGYESLGLR